mmetsp:Transcript_110312/g.172506  ORF Transcript_110312/g.172506 Transcript_110312/m.172506 type:complete len:799 (+) Transcript_110312:104-2500(+)
MRILIKGGVWKNSEDEILKAAVMKYGLNNWARVSSLLARKSPKQCKSRWYEWLDPSVKKTEWTREEEEKLLHLAKLFPTQWRTIAPIVGRTAYQCLEHYEKLLDQAQGRDEMDENDPRRLKPGEIDPHPETKPARADPIDMDEDEKEMLSEARARLANTRGKKAKRKAREKQLEEARRLAALQKRRELKAAGVSTAKKYRNSKRIDYATEIPFEAVPPIGFHATGPEETPKVNLSLANVTLQQVEDRNRQQEEERMRKDDERKLKKLKGDNLPQAIEMINKLNDPQQLLKRTSLNLPAPQLTDTELEQIVKLGADAAALTAQSADSSTASLVQSYGETPGSTPMRTPKQHNSILAEAQDAISRNQMQTPLYGEENPNMNETDWSGALPKPKTGMITPNLYAEQARTPGRTPGATPGATPGMTPGMTPGRTPGRGGMTPGVPGTPGSVADSVATSSFRDGLSLNQPDEMEETMPEKLRKQQGMMQIRDKLDTLPAPVNEVEISMPEFAEEEPTLEDALEEDAADADKRRETLEQQRLEIERQKRSQPVKMDLPRPAVPQACLFPTSFAPGDPQCGPPGSLASQLLHQAEGLLHEEMSALVANDAFLFPVKGGKPPNKKPEIQDFDLDEINAAHALLEAELSQFDAGDFVNLGALQAAKDEGQNFTYVPQEKRYKEWRMLGKREMLEAAKNIFEMSEKEMQRENKRSQKIEVKLERVLGGHMVKAKQALQKIAALAEERDTLEVETDVFRTLRAREESAVASRVEEIRELVEKEKQRNAKLQARYRELQLVKKELEDKLA